MENNNLKSNLSFAAICSLVIGVVSIVCGVAAGVLSIISSVKIIKVKKDIN